MYTPLQSALPGDSSHIDSSETIALQLQSEHQSVTVDRDGFLIGASRQCDLQLTGPSIPPLHSLIHLQSGAIWIEAADEDTVIFVNDRSCRRMALRNGDRLGIGETEFVVQIGSPIIALLAEEQVQEQPDQNAINEDLALLTAEELCDRIVSEQSLVSELSEEDRSGWEALLQAIEAVNEEPEINRFVDEITSAQAEDLAVFDTLLGEINELNETIADRSRELSAHEAEVLAAASLLEESQQQVSQRIDEILDHLQQTDTPAEFRASA